MSDHTLAAYVIQNLAGAVMQVQSIQRELTLLFVNNYDFRCTQLLGTTTVAGSFRQLQSDAEKLARQLSVIADRLDHH